jgi:hypothetical protein
MGTSKSASSMWVAAAPDGLGHGGGDARQLAVEGVLAGAARKDEEFHAPDCNTGRRRIPAVFFGLGVKMYKTP